MLLLIVILFFVSIGYLAYVGMPILMGRYSATQKERMEHSSKDLDRMFVATRAPQMLMIYTLIPISLAAVGFVMTHSVIGLGVGLVLGSIIPPIVIKYMVIMRRYKFQGQLVDALMILSSALKAGMSLNQSVQILVEEMPAPMNEEFALVVRENNMGVPLEECLEHLRIRMPIDDLGLVTSAITVARETGGDLTEIFSQLVFTIREKIKLERKVRTLTVQGRLQGAIMGLLPIAFGAFIYKVNPENFDIMLSSPVGRMLLIWAVASEIIGIILIRKLSKVEV